MLKEYRRTPYLVPETSGVFLFFFRWSYLVLTAAKKIEKFFGPKKWDLVA